MYKGRNRWVAIGIMIIVVMAVVYRSMIEVKEPDSMKIALITNYEQGQFFKNLRLGVENAVSEFDNIELHTLWNRSYRSVNEQSLLIQNAIEEKYNAIIISRDNHPATTEQLEKAHNLGIEIVLVDSGSTDNEQWQYFSSDNTELVHAIAKEAVRQHANPQSYVIVSSNDRSDNLSERQTALYQTLTQEYGWEYAGNVILDVEEAKPEEALWDFMLEQTQVTVMIGITEMATEATGNVRSRLSPKRQIAAYGTDVNLAILNFLEESSIDMIVVQNSYMMGYLAVQAIYQHQMGGKTISESPKIPFKEVRKENMFDEEVLFWLYPIN